MRRGAESRLQTFWDIRAACNFIGGGSGSSLLLWAALGLLAGLPYYPAALIGLMFVGAGLLMVWLEIGKPWRAFNVFFRPQTSWMTREGIVALPLFAAGAISVFFAADLAPPLSSRSAEIPAVLTAFLSLTFLYCQLRILNTARAVPAWREPRAMVLVGLSGLTEGLGVYLLLTAMLGIMSAVMMALMVIMVIARALAWHAYTAAINRSSAPEETKAVLTGVRKMFLFSGHVLPVSLIIIAYVWPGVANVLLALAGIAATLGGWLLKVVLVTRAAYIPKTTIPNLPVRGF